MRAAPIKGLHKATARTADGGRRTYWYAWKGGPRLEGEPGTPAFEASYRLAIERRKLGRHGDTLAGLVAAYRASPEFQNRSASTLKEWARFLDLIQTGDGPLAIASLPAASLNDPRVRQHLLAWRDQWRTTPRKADYAMQVLSAVLSWGVDRGTLAVNVLIGHKGLYASNRADQIWSEEEIARFVDAASSPEVGHIMRLACLTGLRRGDLVRLEWENVGDLAIVIEPNKSRRRRPGKTVTIPLLDEALELLIDIKAQQDQRWATLAERAMAKSRMPPPRPHTVLSTTRGRAWSVNGAEHQVIDAKKRAGIDKHLHDARGTFATRLRQDGATAAEIAQVLGWSESRVERLLERYIDRDSVVRAIAERIRERAQARKTRA